MLKNFKHDWSYPLVIKFLIADTHWEELKNCIGTINKEVAISDRCYDNVIIIGNKNCIIDFSKFNLDEGHLSTKEPPRRCSFMFIDSDIAALSKFKEDLEEIYMPLCNYKWNFVEIIKFCNEFDTPAQVEFISI